MLRQRLARRIGKKKAVIAVGHSILVISWHLLTDDCDYNDLGGDYFQRRANPDRHRDHLIAQLHNLGYPSHQRRLRDRVSGRCRVRSVVRVPGA